MEGFSNGYPDAQTAAAWFDELDYQRAVQAYVWGVPLVNGVALLRALVARGVSLSEPSLYVFDHALTPKQVLMTANAEVIYGFTGIDLAATGPVMIDAPEALFGVVCDLWNRAVVDIGLGPAHGQRILLVPPGYDGDIPDGYFPVTPRTRRVFLLIRGIVTPGQSPNEFVELVSTMRISKLADGEQETTRVIRNGTRPFDSDWPKDAGYFELLADGLSDTPVDDSDKLMYAMLAPLGLGPAANGPPDQRAQRIFERAAETGAAMVSTLAFANRLDLRKPWPGRRWEPIAANSSHTFETDVKVELDERTQGWYQLVSNAVFAFGPARPDLTAAVPGTGSTTPGQGSWYVLSYRDATGAYLDGARSYRLKLTQDPPAAHFWSATVYSNRTRSMVDAPHGLAALSTYSALTRNDDGSADLYFGPEPPAGREGNWIQTNPGEGFFVMFRLYGPLREALDGTWQLDDIRPLEG